MRFTSYSTISLGFVIGLVTAHSSEMRVHSRDLSEGSHILVARNETGSPLGPSANISGNADIPSQNNTTRLPANSAPDNSTGPLASLGANDTGNIDSQSNITSGGIPGAGQGNLTTPVLPPKGPQDSKDPKNHQHAKLTSQEKIKKLEDRVAKDKKKLEGSEAKLATAKEKLAKGETIPDELIEPAHHRPHCKPGPHPPHRENGDPPPPPSADGHVPPPPPSDVKEGKTTKSKDSGSDLGKKTKEVGGDDGKKIKDFGDNQAKINGTDGGK